jgi:lipopolysaccharide export system protein LptC
VTTRNQSSLFGRAELARRFQRAQRHSRRVRLLRVAVPMLGVVVFVSIVLAQWLNPMARLARLPEMGGTLVVSGRKITMQAPRLAGVTRDNRVYEMTAEAAAQDILRPGILELTGIRGKVELRERSMVDLTAAAGIYDTKTDVLKLTQNIVVVFSAGYQGHLSEVVLDTRKGYLVSEKPVEVHMENGMINSNRMEIVDSGALIRFDGGVEMRIVPKLDSPAARKAVR